MALRGYLQDEGLVECALLFRRRCWNGGPWAAVVMGIRNNPPLFDDIAENSSLQCDAFFLLSGGKVCSLVGYTLTVPSGGIKILLMTGTPLLWRVTEQKSTDEGTVQRTFADTAKLNHIYWQQWLIFR